MMIPEDQIDLIKERLDIVDVISEYISLKSAGRNSKGLCPFHGEKTPSFVVSSEKQIFHCFGCGAGGNVFTFLMKVESLSFVEAVKKLAPKAGVKIENDDRNEKKQTETQNKKETILKMNRWGMEQYHRYLMKDANALEPRHYLENRGIGMKTREEFKLGFSPNLWQFLSGALLKKKVSRDLILESGLAAVSKNNDNIYDYFRNRLMFPIQNTHLNIVGFGARTLEKEGQPKYLNSKDSPVYNKSLNLYGLAQARAHIAENDSVIVVEGYFDVLSLYDKGIKNVVAPLGTALTQDQIRLIKRYTRSIIMLFDGDKAGIEAVKRSLSLLLKEEMSGQIVILPDSLDPDDYIKKYGAEKLLKLIKNSKDYVLYLLDSLSQDCGNSITGKSKVLDEILPYVQEVPHLIQRNLYIKEIAERLDIEENRVHLLMDRMKHSQRLPESKSIPKSEVNSMDMSEKTVVLALLQDKKFIDLIREADIIDLISHSELRRVAELLMKLYVEKENFKSSDIVGLCDQPSFVARLLLEASLQSLGERLVNDCCKKIRLRFLIRVQSQLLTELKKEDDPKILQAYQNLVLQQKKLKEEGKTQKKL
ncbi:MAG: DNA primase [Deltaproteobacteria bacterium]|nr:DNA primase [Deltaproteobacteria bacterium]